MTKSFEKIAMGSLHGLDYSNINVKNHVTAEPASETPVLDLSCKKSASPSPTPDFGKEPASVSPLRGSPYLENHQETNNNNNKHINNYQQHHHQEQEIEQNRQSQTHHYHHEDSSSFSSSNHERKSPFDNRSYIMTPPSESDSPKKTKFQSIYDNTSLSIGEARVHPAYPPIIPMNLPVPLPISVPAVLPALMTQNSSTSPVPQMQIPTSSSMHEVSQTSASSDDGKKAPRPFKAYPKDPLSISMGPDMMFDQEMKKAYSDFRNRMLESVKRTNEGTNIKMRRISKSPMLPTSTVDEKDAAYWERRRKNNEAAKRSRDARRAKEDEIAIRAAFLEQEYIRLKYENAVLKDENAKIKCMLYGR